MRDELKAFAAEGITELHTAFSRADGPKTYVQHLVAAQKDRVWSLIEQGAIVYVCGDGGKMEPDVKAALVAIYREKTGADADAGAALDRRSRHEEPLRAGRLGGRVDPRRVRKAQPCPPSRSNRWHRWARRDAPCPTLQPFVLQAPHDSLGKNRHRAHSRHRRTNCA